MSTSPFSGAVAQRARFLGMGLRRDVMSWTRGMSDFIALGRGDPDFDTPAHIVDAAKRALDEGATHYTPWAGIAELREAISSKLETHNGIDADPSDEILVTAGAQEAVFAATQMLLEPGDEVLVPDPHYTAYDGGIELSGATVVPVPTRPSDGFQVSVDALERHVTARTKLLIIVNPSNPCGSVLSPELAHDIAAFAERHDLLVISDEVYESFVYDGRTHVSLASLPGMRSRTISIFSFSKTYAMTGWRVGYLVAPRDVLFRIAEMHYLIAICAPAVSQVAALAALSGPKEPTQVMVASCDERRRLLLAALQDAGFDCAAPFGGFTVMADIRPSGMDSTEFCREALQKARVQIFPGVLYGPAGEGFVRVSFLAPPETLTEAVKRLGALLE